MLTIARRVIYKSSKNILYDQLDYGENFLILYDKTNNHKQIFQNFMREMAADNSILFYVSHKKNQLNFSFDVRTYYFNVINEEILHDLKTELDKCFNKVEKSNRSMLLISDWGREGINLSNCEIFLPFLESLIKRSQDLNPPAWKRKYKGLRQKTPLTLINTFDMEYLQDKFIRQIIPLHHRIYLLQENLNTLLLPTISSSSGVVFPKLHVLPREILEKLAKNNLEVLTLLLLERSDKSGYQILKDIAGHFGCILSQGTLYPLLYKLEKENKILKQKGKGKEVIYSLSKETKDNLQSRKEMLLSAYQHLASFFESGEGGVSKKIKNKN